jgi:Ca2+-binding EF-hand superfamily protein
MSFEIFKTVIDVTVATAAYNTPMKELPDQKAREVRESFEYFDRDHNGFIDFDEFSELLRVISPESTVQQSAEGFSIIDTDSDGYIGLEEFIAWWRTTWWEY